MAYTFTDYNDYLKSNQWKKRKNRYYRRFSYCCFYCRKPYGLDLHHISYENIGNEEDADLVYLCRRHHFLAHFILTGWIYNGLLKLRRRYYQIIQAWV